MSFEKINLNSQEDTEKDTEKDTENNNKSKEQAELLHRPLFLDQIKSKFRFFSAVLALNTMVSASDMVGGGSVVNEGSVTSTILNDSEKDVVENRDDLHKKQGIANEEVNSNELIEDVDNVMSDTLQSIIMNEKILSGFDKIEAESDGEPLSSEEIEKQKNEIEILSKEMKVKGVESLKKEVPLIISSFKKISSISPEGVTKFFSEKNRVKNLDEILKDLNQISVDMDNQDLSLTEIDRMVLLVSEAEHLLVNLTSSVEDYVEQMKIYSTQIEESIGLIEQGIKKTLEELNDLHSSDKNLEIIESVLNIKGFSSLYEFNQKTNELIISEGVLTAKELSEHYLRVSDRVGVTNLSLIESKSKISSHEKRMFIEVSREKKWAELMEASDKGNLSEILEDHTRQVITEAGDSLEEVMDSVR